MSGWTSMPANDPPPEQPVEPPPPNRWKAFTDEELESIRAFRASGRYDYDEDDDRMLQEIDVEQERRRVQQ